jgi:hypothetical protein
LLWFHRFYAPVFIYVMIKRIVHLKNAKDYAYYEKQTIDDPTHEFSHRESPVIIVLDLFESSPKRLLNYSIEASNISKEPLHIA